MDRLLSLYRESEGGLDGLATELETRRSSAPSAALDLVLARLSREAGRLDEARARYEAVLAAHPEELRAELGLATLDRGAGDLSSARQHLMRAAEHATGTEREELLRSIGELSLDLGDFDGASAAYAELGRGARSVHLRGELARALAARGEHARAITAYRDVARDVSGDARVLSPLLVEIARSELALGQLDEAITTLDDARTRAAPSAGIRGEIAALMLDAQRRRGTLDALITAWSSARGAEERLTVAQALDELGRDDEAIAAYGRAIGARPRDAEARLGQIRVLLRSGRIDDAIAGYRALLRVAARPQHVIALAELLEAHGRRDEALSITDRLMATARASDVSTLDALAALFLRWNDGARATRALSRRAALSPLDPVPLVALGDQLLASGDAEGASAAFARILSLGGDPATAHATLGGVYLDHDRLPEAIAELETAIRLRREADRPVEIETARLLANAYERASDETRAEAAWRAVLDAAGSDGGLRREAREHIVSSWARGRVLDAHIAELRASFHGEPPDLDAGRFLVEALRRRRDLADAVATLRELDALAPSDIASLELLERLEVQRGDLGGAIDALERLARAEPRRAAERYRRMAEHALDLYRDEDALRYARRAVELSPEDAEGWSRLAELWRARGDLAAAAQALRRAVELDARRYELALSLAALEIARGEIDAAESLLLRVVSSSPDDALVTEAVRATLDLHASEPTSRGARLAPLESALLSQVLRAPERIALRRAFVDLLRTRVLSVSRDPASAAEVNRMVTRGLAPLLLSIGSSDPLEAASAIELVRIARVPGAASTLLSRAEREGDAAARLEALATLAPLVGPAHASRLVSLTQHGDPMFRALATWTLGRALEGDRPALERALTPLLSDSEREVRSYAALALGGRSASVTLGAAARAAAHARMEAGGPDLPLLGWALARAMPEEVESRFRTPLTSAPSTLAPLTYRALARTERPQAIRALLSALLDGDRRSAATLALRSELALPSDADPRPLETASAFVTRALGSRALDLGALEAPLTQVLLSGLAADATEEMHRATLALLVPTWVGDRPGVTLEGLSIPLDRPEARVPEATMRALEGSLSALTHDPNLEVRTRAFALLAAGPREGDPTLYAAALEDEAPTVLRAVLEARGGAPVGPDLLPVLIRMLETHGDWSVRALSATALGRSPSFEAETALVSAAQSDAFALVRDAAVRALSRRSDLSESARASLVAWCRVETESRVREALTRWLSCE